MSKSSVFDEIGGTLVVSTAVTILYDRVTADPLLSEWFDGIDLRRLKAHQLDFLTVALGGPDEFGGRSIHEAHAGLAVTNAAFDAIVAHLAAVLEDLGVADDGIEVIAARLEGQRDQIVQSS
ncbi:MAG: group 1 hemoglobin [Subtercola sp.]|nr:group 1 hemoglobin [Subtercola sp.]